MGFNLFGSNKKSMEELQQENERLEVEYSVEEKKAMIRELRQRGQDPQHFKDGKGGINFSKVWAWLKTH